MSCLDQRSSRLLLVACGVVLTLCLAGCGAKRSVPAAEAELIAELSRDRFTLGRLAETLRPQLCVDADTGFALPRVRCGTHLEARSRDFERVVRTAVGVQAALDANQSSAALRAAALLELRLSNHSPQALSKAVDLLGRASRLDAADAKVLNDLAVAELELAMETQDLSAALRSLEAVSRALEIDSTLAAARFNRAVVLDRLHLLASADEAWSRVAATDTEREWRREAGVRQAVAAARTTRGLLQQKARDSCFVLLSQWGTAILQGDSAAVTRYLELARATASVGDTSPPDRDGSVALALAAIDSAAPNELSALASAHAAYGDGVQLYGRANYEEAVGRLRQAAEAFRSAGSAMQGWAEFYHAASLVNLGEFERADSVFTRVLAAARHTQPALSGKAIWALGVSQVRRGNYDNAIGFYRAAKADIVRAHEPENEGALTFVLSEALLLEGQTVAGGAEAYRALRLLSQFRRSSFLSNHLNVVARYARAAGLTRASLEVMNEAVAVAPGVGKADVVAWARCDRARDLIALSRDSAALQDLDRAAVWTASISDGSGRERVAADVDLVRATLLRRESPSTAMQRLSQVEAAYRRLRIGFNIPTALYEAAVTARATGDLAGAEARLQRAVTELERQATTLTTQESRAKHAETSEHVFDMLIDLQGGTGNARAAFTTLERGRIAATPRGKAAASRGERVAPFVDLDSIRAHLPRDMAAIEYGVLADRVWIWVVSPKGWETHQTLATRDSVSRLVERFNRENTHAVPGQNDASAVLYDMLVRPVLQHVDGTARLAIIPDRELGRLPFSALWDRKTNHFLIEMHELRVAPSAAFLLQALRARVSPLPRDGVQALVIGDPSLDSSLVRELPPLPGAQREATRIASLYRRHTLLMGNQSRRGEVLRLAPHASVLHFAGHSVFNTERPELSFLALSPDPGSSNGILRAREISDLRLSNLSVAILAACSSLSPRVTRNGAMSGLAYSFLRAGVPAIVSTLWDVDDETAVELLVSVHQGLVDGKYAPGALRDAQVQALHSSNPELRKPRTWAAYVYVGQ